jgi:tRNA(Arg) A34 adenosine deaminase TadA
MQQIFIDLIELAIENPHKYKLAAAVGNRKEQFIGINSAKSHPFQARWGRNPESIYFHAEIAALKEALVSYDPKEVKGMQMWVARVKKVGGVLVPALARPCSGCLAAARAFGIRTITYTTETEYGMETIKL